MPIAMMMRWPDATAEQYDQLRKVVNWEGEHPDGGVLHIATFDASGARIVDVWESPEHFQRFVDQRLTPGVQAVGIPGEPAVEILPVHALFIPGLVPAS